MSSYWVDNGIYWEMNICIYVYTYLYLYVYIYILYVEQKFLQVSFEPPEVLVSEHLHFHHLHPTTISQFKWNQVANEYLVVVWHLLKTVIYIHLY